MRLYLKLYNKIVEILDPSMLAVREVSDRLITLSHKHRDSLSTEIIYSNDYKVESVMRYVLFSLSVKNSNQRCLLNLKRSNKR